MNLSGRRQKYVIAIDHLINNEPSLEFHMPISGLGKNPSILLLFLQIV